MEMKGVYYEKSSDCNVGNVGIFDRRSWNFEFIFFSFAWGGPEQSYLYPIYGGIIVLTGVVVGAADVIVNEIKDLKKSISDRINNNIDILDNF